VSAVADNLAEVKERISAAARKAGRKESDVKLVAVTKGHEAPRLREAVAAGHADLGENYVQELVGKLDALSQEKIIWHLIGPLQRNKVRHVAGRIAMLHTLDSAPLANELQKRLDASNASLDVLVQVNVGKEPQKHGLAPADVPALLEEARQWPRLHVLGLMTIPPFFDEPERARPLFAELRTLRDDLQKRFPALSLHELSMGMSGDFEVAIEEGATLVRVGTAIFGERPRPPPKEKEEQ